LALIEVSSGRDHSGPVTSEADLVPLDDPESLAAASDTARMNGEARTAARLRLRLLRDMLAVRDQMTRVLELADVDRASIVRELEDDLIEQLIRPTPGAPNLTEQVRDVLDAQAALVMGVIGTTC
jgi:hypothetical protein